MHKKNIQCLNMKSKIAQRIMEDTPEYIKAKVKQYGKQKMKNLESRLQQVCVQWFKLKYPKRLIAAIPNGGKRNVITASIMKREGTLKGCPDLFIPEPNKHYPGLFIEMKHGKNKPSKEQVEVMDKLRERGYKVELCYTFDSFVEIVDEYFSL
jgi:hypothetical protein